MAFMITEARRSCGMSSREVQQLKHLQLHLQLHPQLQLKQYQQLQSKMRASLSSSTDQYGCSSGRTVIGNARSQGESKLPLRALANTNYVHEGTQVS